MAEKPFLHLVRQPRTKKEPRPKLQNFVRKSGAFAKEHKKDFKYTQFEQLYELWCEYFRELVVDSDGNVKAEDRLLKADFHGALLMVGLHGIVALETRHTFQLITRQDKLIVIPKQGTTFQFVFAGHVFTLFGDNLRQIPHLRGKKGRPRLSLPFFLR